jgi:hypothetical protein
MQVAWILAPYSLTLDELYARDPACRFFHNDVLYVRTLRAKATPEGDYYDVVASGAALPTRLLGSAVVTPVTPAPRPRYL